MLGPGQVQRQDAVGVAGLSALGVDGGGQGESLLLDVSPLFCYNAV